MSYSYCIPCVHKFFITRKIYLFSWLELSSREARITITEEERDTVTHSVIDSAFKMMERIITEKSAKNRAKSWSKEYKQSRATITSDTVLFNILTDVQRLPARRRDFRLNLSEEEKKIGGPELSDVLASMVRKYLLEPKRSKFPFPRGRPSSYIDLDEERRGRLSYYEESRVKNILDEVVKDPDHVRRIDNEILGSTIFYRFLRYSFEAAFYQMKEDKEGFLNSFKPAIRKYVLAQKEKRRIRWIMGICYRSHSRENKNTV